MANVDFSVLPAKVTVTNTSADAVTVQVYRTNSYYTIPAGDSISLQVKESNELLYWMAQAIDGKITAAKAAMTTLAVEPDGVTLGINETSGKLEVLAAGLIGDSGALAVTGGVIDVAGAADATAGQVFKYDGTDFAFAADATA